jgi:hypothetical protein
VNSCVFSGHGDDESGIYVRCQTPGTGFVKVRFVFFFTVSDYVASDQHNLPDRGLQSVRYPSFVFLFGNLSSLS